MAELISAFDVIEPRFVRTKAKLMNGTDTQLSVYTGIVRPKHTGLAKEYRSFVPIGRDPEGHWILEKFQFATPFDYTVIVSPCSFYGASNSFVGMSSANVLLESVRVDDGHPGGAISNCLVLHSNIITKNVELYEFTYQITIVHDLGPPFGTILATEAAVPRPAPA